MSNRLVTQTAIRLQIPTGKRFLPDATWTPADITTNAWYDAADADTITESGGAVSQWDDKSGNDYHVTQGTGADQPSYNSTTKEIDFDGTTDKLSDLVSSIVSGNPDLMIAVVMAPDANVASNDRMVSLGTGGGTMAALSIGTEGYSWRFENGKETFDAVTFDLQTVVGVRASGSDYQSSLMYKNGTALTSSGSANPTNTPNIGTGVVIGDTQSAPTPYDGGIFEIVIAEDATTNTRQKIEGYLAWKWGLEANLPGGHPYKNSAPTV